RGKTSYIAPNLLNRDFNATKPNQKWVTDVTEFHLGQAKLYFSALMDLANREIIAYQFATRPKFSMVKKMLEQGLSQLSATDCPIIHSDQGVTLRHERMAADAGRQSDTEHEQTGELL
ncbi:DDE-type integrase/transposase/recombinase, partial [Actinobacillus vicugnae]|uniref:DDE-type integrase/transposase/recombinase n=1 Tax=Actinobacillus vicugnae TaxID=2573093 RepID=UPI00124008CD